jgi:23S rRNA (cytosine1962-C5)-methyltransferase
MIILSTSGWNEYELLDTGEGKRLERFGAYTLIRPDPQIIWKSKNPESWKRADAVFTRTQKDKGVWETRTTIPDKWLVKYKNLSFYCKLTSFKHTGMFPEQSMQWDWMHEKIQKSSHPVNVLNLFGYTGIASLAASAAGARVTHVDASKSTIAWAKENQEASGLGNMSVRWILDDAITFIKREVKRGITYDGIIMDPPVYGHGPGGQVWDFEKSFPQLIKLCSAILSDIPLFVLVNAYAVSSSSIMLENVLKDYLKNGSFQSGELALLEHSGGRLLSTGIFSRWSMI